MSKRAGGLAISYAIDEASASDNDDDLLPSNGMRKPSNLASAAQNRGRPTKLHKQTTSKTSVAKPRGRRASAGNTFAGDNPAKEKSAGANLQAVVSIPHTQAADESDDVDEFDLAPDPASRAMSTPATATKTTAQRPKKPASDGKPKTSRGRPKKQAENEEIPETQPDVQISSTFGRNTAVKRPPRPVKREVVPETQAEAMDVDITSTTKDDETVTTSKAKMKPPPRKRAASQQRQPSVTRKRAGSASDTEKSADPALRRKLGDMTKKFENISVRYDQLRDVGLGEAENNFDSLKAQSNERLKAAEALIASLQQDVATQSTLASEAAALRTELNTVKASQIALTAQKKTLETNLASAQTEIKTLQAKVVASRSGSEQAVKGPANARNVPVIAGEAERRVLQLKEELYADLTGLLVRDVKRRDAEGEEVYDCIQTGRNGTLRFQLTIPTLDTTTTYSDAEFAYEPVFDASGNDRSLIALLPDYLTEEICFPRRQAAKFYQRIVECLTRRVEDGDAGGEVAAVKEGGEGNQHGDGA